MDGPKDRQNILQSELAYASVPHLFLLHAGQDIKDSQASVICRRVRTCNGLTSVNLFGKVLSVARVSVVGEGGGGP